MSLQPHWGHVWRILRSIIHRPETFLLKNVSGIANPTGAGQSSFESAGAPSFVSAGLDTASAKIGFAFPYFLLA